MSGGDLLLLLVLGACVLLALRAIRRGKTGGCGGHCDSCTHRCRR